MPTGSGTNASANTDTTGTYSGTNAQAVSNNDPCANSGTYTGPDASDMCEARHRPRERQSCDQIWLERQRPR